jgi:UDP-N-acetylglucosamine--N-acetylmuramyl-(pentapeptide) pyrophosphoryl-undecaprenol N-acetylglucosamine transferase
MLKVRRLDGEGLSAELEIRLLIMGGSQGSTIMSEVVPRALLQLPIEFRSLLSVVQQCRISDQEMVRSVYEAASIKATVVPFITHLAEVLGDIHLVICRAGASTVAELAAAGRPALLVPFPYATDDHQMENARAFESAGGGWVITENDFNIKNLTAALCRIFGDLNQLITAGARARAASTPDAALRVAQLATQLASKSCGTPQ